MSPSLSSVDARSISWSGVHFGLLWCDVDAGLFRRGGRTVVAKRPALRLFFGVPSSDRRTDRCSDHPRLSVFHHHTTIDNRFVSENCITLRISRPINPPRPPNQARP